MKTIILLLLSTATFANDLIYKHGFEDTVAVAGAVSGLNSTGLNLVLYINGNNTETISISANGAFVFAANLVVGENWSVEISTLPGSPQQSCNLSNTSGTIPQGGVDTIQIACDSQAWNWNEMNWGEGGWN